MDLYSLLLPVHISAMALSGVGMITGFLILKYRGGNPGNRLRMHKMLQWCSAVIGAAGVVSAVIMVEDTFGTHLNVPHSIFAVASFALVVLALVVGYGVLRKKRNKKQMRTVHIWMSRIAILAWLVTIVLGLLAAGIL